MPPQEILAVNNQFHNNVMKHRKMTSFAPRLIKCGGCHLTSARTKIIEQVPVLHVPRPFPSLVVGKGQLCETGGGGCAHIGGPKVMCPRHFGPTVIGKGLKQTSFIFL